MRQVSREAWIAELSQVQAAGWTYLDLLTAVDRDTEIEVVVRVVNPAGAAGLLMATRIPADRPLVPSATSVYPSAAWHEREAAEMFGLEFEGHPDPRPLLRRTVAGRPPLRKTTVLAARVVTPWPGAVDGAPGRSASRRRQQPAGVPEAWLRGTADPVEEGR